MGRKIKFCNVYGLHCFGSFSPKYKTCSFEHGGFEIGVSIQGDILGLILNQKVGREVAGNCG